MNPSFLNSLPNEIVAYTLRFLDPRSKRALSMVEWHFRAVVLNNIKTLHLHPPKYFQCSYTFNDVILVSIIHNRPALHELIIGPLKGVNGVDEFSGKEEKPLGTLSRSSAFEMIKKVRFREIHHDAFCSFMKEDAKKLNQLFLQSLAHETLENLKIRSYHLGSVLTGVEIQPLLNNSPNLKTFVYNGFQSDESVDLLFKSNPQMTKVKFLNWSGSGLATHSLMQCHQLQELVIHYKGIIRQTKKTIISRLSGKVFANLKRLELKGVPLDSGSEFEGICQNFPQLECLNAELYDTYSGASRFDFLGHHCPGLKILKLTYRELTNSKLKVLTENLQNLEALSLDRAVFVTEEGISSLAVNCPHLRFLEIEFPGRIATSGFQSLGKHCPELRVLRFENGGPIALLGVIEMVENLTCIQLIQLKIKLTSNSVCWVDRKNRLFRERGITSKFPILSSAKQIYGLCK